uniref:Endoplasmic reticulum transmembrane protein n=1 Tax=Nicoletia phytophila TaxID=1350298 RepID=A0A481SWT8_9INSE|nr:bcr-associated protein [Nicoletia phytophila]
MSIQWTIIATFLYAEIGVVLLLVLPIASPQRWQKIFKSRFLQSIGNQASLYFFVLLVTLVLFFLDAIREMRKYSEKFSQESEGHQHQHLDAEMQVNMRLFRAQRNFYISGFALFLCLVIRRLVTLISSQANLLAQHEAAMKQAESASNTARNLMSQNQARSGEAAQNVTNEAHDKEVNELKEKLTEAEKSVKRIQTDRDSMKRQADSVSTEYDRLLEEHRKLQQKMQVLEGGAGDKKDD